MGHLTEGKRKKRKKTFVKPPSDPVYSWSTGGELSEGRILIKNPSSHLSDPPGFLWNSNPGSSLLAVPQIAVKVLNCWLLFLSMHFFLPIYLFLMPFTLSVELLLLCSSVPLPLDLSYAEHTNASTRGKIQQEPLCSQWIHLLQLFPTLPGLHKYSSWILHNKVSSWVWLHHLSPSMCTFPGPATPLNFQQGRDWQLNGKLPNSECSDSSNEADIIIIALFWKPQSLQTSIALGILYKGTVNTSVHSQSPNRVKYRDRPVPNKKSTQWTKTNKKPARNGSIWSFGARNQALLPQLF